LEVYQFARDAAVAEAWLIAQEPYLMSSELGHTIDEVENLIKKHEAFEKSAAAQEERFSALERLTTVSDMPMKSMCVFVLQIITWLCYNFGYCLVEFAKESNLKTVLSTE
jgi:hypothetical protein